MVICRHSAAVLESHKPMLSGDSCSGSSTRRTIDPNGAHLSLSCPCPKVNRRKRVPAQIHGSGASRSFPAQGGNGCPAVTVDRFGITSPLSEKATFVAVDPSRPLQKHLLQRRPGHCRRRWALASFRKASKSSVCAGGSSGCHCRPITKLRFGSSIASTTPSGALAETRSPSPSRSIACP